MFRGKFFTGEKLKKYSDFWFINGIFTGSSLTLIGLSIGTWSATPAFAAVVISGVGYGYQKVFRTQFSKIDEAIEQAGGEGSQ